MHLLGFLFENIPKVPTITFVIPDLNLAPLLIRLGISLELITIPSTATDTGLDTHNTP